MPISKLEETLYFGTLAVIILLPLQTFITIAVANYVGNLYLVSAWKEILIVFLGIVAVLIADHRRQTFRNANKWLIILTALYVGLIVLYVSLNFSTQSLAGAAINLRFLVAFWIGWVLSSTKLNKNTPRTIAYWIVVMGLVVSVIALLFITVAPRDFLVSVGYDAPGVNRSGIPPAYHTVANSSLMRAQATLRGPNALGAYLILPFSLVLFSLRNNRPKQVAVWGALILLSEVILLTFSRSAWIAIGITVVVWLVVTKRAWLQKNLKFILIGLICILTSLILLRDVTFIRHVVFHESTSTSIMSSSEGHWLAVKNGTIDIWAHPFGQGIGSAGPVSALKGQAKISENYFLQIGQEVGLLGLGLIIAIHLILLKLLWQNRFEPFVIPVLVAFSGLIITNLLLHTWADEVVSITLWSFMGLILGTAIIEQKTIKNVSRKKPKYHQKPNRD